jgi:superfamily II DNA or RNA helicase
MPAQTLRDYQERGVQSIFDAWRSGARSVLAVAPTGSGKTSVFSWIASKLHVPVLVLVHRRELATQAANRLREFGVGFGYIMSGEPSSPGQRVQIASVQTLVRRKPPPARLVICDEAHLSTAKTWSKILEAFPTSKILGCTATPFRLSGKPLAATYDATVIVARPAELREQGHLCDYVGFSYLAPDLSEVKTTAGDYDEKQSEAAMRQPSIVANIVSEWTKHARELSTIVFAVTVEHSKELCAEFRTAGVTAEHLDGTTSLEARKAILKRLETGATRVLCNVGVAIEGLDVPRVKCIVLARPTKSLARYLQMVGRGRRPWGGLKLRIHDHAFLLSQHGMPDDERDYSLNAKKERPPSEMRNCPPPCGAWYSGARCPECKSEGAPRGEREIVTIDDAEQFSFDSSSKTMVEVSLPEDRSPVEVRWSQVGQVIEGSYVGSYVEQRTGFSATVHEIVGKKRRYVFPGAVQLNRALAGVSPGTVIRVTYEGERAIGGGKWMKKFHVEVDR